MIYYLLWRISTQRNPYLVMLGSFTEVGLHRRRLLKSLVFLKRWCLVGLRNSVLNQELQKRETNGETTTTCGKASQRAMPQYITGLRRGWVKQTDVFIAGLKRPTEVLLSGRTLTTSTRGI